MGFLNAYFVGLMLQYFKTATMQLRSFVISLKVHMEDLHNFNFQRCETPHVVIKELLRDRLREDYSLLAEEHGDHSA